MSEPDLRPRVERCAEALGASVDVASVDRIVAWCALVRETNARIDLTAARSDDELVDLLVADALVLAPKIPAGARVVDVGSGAGAPGLPIGLLRPDLDVTLVEPLDKRVAFLRSAIGRAAVARAPRVHRGRGEALVPRAGGTPPFDVALSRATLPPPEWLALGAQLAPEVWVLVARAGAATAAVEAEAVEAIDYVWPLTGAVRRALRATRRTP